MAFTHSEEDLSEIKNALLKLECKILTPLHNWFEFHKAEIEIKQTERERELTGRNLTLEEYDLKLRHKSFLNSLKKGIEPKYANRFQIPNTKPNPNDGTN